jgi:hypothetical protein
MAFHAKKSASGSKGWIKCSGRLAYVDSLPANMRRPTGAAAMTGTCAHGLGEHLLRRGERTVGEEWQGRIIWLDEAEDAYLGVHNEIPEDIETRSQLSAHLNGADVKFFTRIDQKMIDGVQLYLDVVWQDFDEMGSTVEMAIEQRLDLSWLRPDMGGTSDCTLYQFLGLLRVIDYKNGYVTVDADGNTQGMYYALGEAHRVGWLFDEVEVVIVQPNSKDGRPVKRFRLTKAELETFRDMLAEASDRVDEATAALEECRDQVDFMEWASTYLYAGDDDDHDHCTYCDALPICPAAKARMEELARADFADEPYDQTDVDVVDQEGLERLTRILKWADYLDRIVKAAKVLGQRRLETGEPMPGQKLVRGKANRKYVDDMTDDEIAAELAKATGKPAEAMWEKPKEPKLLSPSQAEKVGGVKAKRRIAGTWDENIEGWSVPPLAVKPEGKIVMAPETDPREAVNPGVIGDDFVDDIEHDYEEEV